MPVVAVVVGVVVSFHVPSRSRCGMVLFREDVCIALSGILDFEAQCSWVSSGTGSDGCVMVRPCARAYTTSPKAHRRHGIVGNSTMVRHCQNMLPHL